MAKLSGVPETVDLDWLAGDTLTLSITVPESLIAGRVWSAQVRSTTDATLIDATFAVVEPTEADGPAYLTLTADDTATLLYGAPATSRVVSGRTVTGGKYTGVWDVQLAPAGGGDPVTTLCRGALTIVGDVTRVE